MPAANATFASSPHHKKITTCHLLDLFQHSGTVKLPTQCFHNWTSAGKFEMFAVG